MDLKLQTTINRMSMSNVHCCKFSGNYDLVQIMSLGNVPVADKLLTKDEFVNEKLMPLDLVFSTGSKLVQIKETIPASLMYNERYPYFSSVSPALLQHFKKSAINLIKRKKLGNSSLVVEAASNDGYMLKTFIEQDIPVLGIEPAKLQAEIAARDNIPTLNTFFTENLAHQLVAENKLADLFLANNVLAHAENLNDFVSGISVILKPDGLAVIEVPYVVDLVNNCEFDTIYHQHIYYFSLLSLMSVFNKYNLHINEVERLEIHGGSIRLYIEKIKNTGHSVHKLLQNENALGLDCINFYKSLEFKTVELKKKLLKLLRSLKSEGKSIAAYGAAGKANTFLSYMQIDNNLIDYIVDLNPRKHGLYMGGNHLEIYPTTNLYRDQPDYTLILAWNFANEIINQMSEYRQSGGKFIVPIPHLKII